jgi:hypothetical protein
MNPSDPARASRSSTWSTTRTWCATRWPGCCARAACCPRLCQRRGLRGLARRDWRPGRALAGGAGLPAAGRAHARHERPGAVRPPAERGLLQGAAGDLPDRPRRRARRRWPRSSAGPSTSSRSPFPTTRWSTASNRPCRQRAGAAAPLARRRRATGAGRADRARARRDAAGDRRPANKLIADALGISVRTVEVHRARVFDKMNVKSAVELANLLRGSGA